MDFVTSRILIVWVRDNVVMLDFNMDIGYYGLNLGRVDLILCQFKVLPPVEIILV